MNSVSWLIYTAETLYNLVICLRVFTILGGLAALVFCGICIANYFDKMDDYNNGYGDKHKERAEAWAKRAPKKSFIACAILFVLTFAFPTPTTIYLIAASEIGEEIVKRPEIQSTYTDLMTVIQKKIAEAMTEGGK